MNHLEKIQLKLWIILIAILIQCPVCNFSAVSWELRSPAVFGSTTYLLCKISDDANECIGRKRQWLGGPRNAPLCQDDSCGNDTKYDVMSDPNMCSYTLMIYNFSFSDVECYYTCSFGATSMRQSLVLNDKDFIYIPAKKDKESQITRQGTVVSYSMIIKNIYPSPRCIVSFQGVNLNLSTEVNTTKPGLLYTTEINVIGSLPSCSGNILVECILGNSTMDTTEEKINSCEDQMQEKGIPREILAIVLSIVSLVILVAVCYVYVKRQYCLYCLWNRRSQHESNQENITTVPLTLYKPASNIGDNDEVEPKILLL